MEQKPTTAATLAPPPDDGAGTAPAVSIVVPFFDEEESLDELASEIAAAMKEATLSWEVVLVDDGSTDDGARVARRLAAGDRHFRLVQLPENRGQSAALAAGIGHARAATIVTLDADLQNDPADIPRLLAALDGWDVVSGVRRTRRDSWLRRVSSRIANRVRARILGDAISDVGCSLKAYRASVLRGVPFFNGFHRFLPALALLKGARIRELDVNHRPRRFGRSKYGIGNRLVRGVVDLWGVRWLQKRWIDRGEAREHLARDSEGALAAEAGARPGLSRNAAARMNGQRYTEEKRR